MLEKEFQYYLDHQAELIAKYNGRVIVIKDCNVIGDFTSEIEAINKAQEQYELGTFLVQKCEPGEESFTRIFHSRYAIA